MYSMKSNICRLILYFQFKRLLSHETDDVLSNNNYMYAALRMSLRIIRYLSDFILFLWIITITLRNQSLMTDSDTTSFNMVCLHRYFQLGNPGTIRESNQASGIIRKAHYA